MIKLFLQIDHTEGKRTFADFRITVDEYVIVRPILLMIGVPDRTWDDCVTCSLGKWLSNLGAEFAIPFGDIVYHLKSSIIKMFDRVFQERTLASLLVEGEWTLDMSHEFFIV